MNRTSWDDFFMQVAIAVSKRGSCLRRQVGCVLVFGNKIIGTGYNGAIAGDANCDEVGCLMINGHCVRCLHAEVNSVLNSLCYDVSVSGVTAYVTSEPCFACYKVLRQFGVNRFVYLEEYADDVRDGYLCNEENVIWDNISLSSR